MGLGCGTNMLKYILFFLNFLIFIMALVGVVASLVFIFKPSTLDEAGDVIKGLDSLKDTLSPGAVKVGLYVVLAASVIILLISFCGCCGAWKEIKFLLGMYATVLLLILIVEIAAFVVVIVFKGKVKGELKKGLEEAKKDNATLYGDLETTLKCCGVTDGQDCVKPEKGTTPPNIGCFNRIVNLLESMFTMVLVVSIVTVVVEVFLISFSCCLCSNIGENVA